MNKIGNRMFWLRLFSQGKVDLNMQQESLKAKSKVGQADKFIE